MPRADARAEEAQLASLLPDPRAEASFLAYLHYLEDLAGVIGGRHGWSTSLVEGVYEAVVRHASRTPAGPAPEQRPHERLRADDLRALHAVLQGAWDHLLRLECEIGDPVAYDRVMNAALPHFALGAVVAAAQALAVVERADVGSEPEDALDYLDARVASGLLPFPWNARCVGCPQVGTAEVEGVAPGPVSVLASPDPDTSEARVAMLLRTTRARMLERRFAAARREQVRPGRSRRNLTRETKEEIAAACAPTTPFALFWRLHDKVRDDAGVAFVTGPFDAVEAHRFAVALTLVTDASLAAIEAVIGPAVGWELLADLAGACVRRTGAGANSGPARRRRAALALGRARSSRPGHRDPR